MESFDPLFDEEPPAVRLCLPTNEFPHPFVAPSPISYERDVEIFDKNVGTIALPGSQTSEHPPAFSLASSVRDPGQAQANVTPKQRQKPSKTPKERPKRCSTRKKIQQQQPYKPATQSDRILAQLAKDPNVVPLLQAVVEYVYRTELCPSQPQPTSPPPSAEQSSKRPTKRRRLNRVPAGAEDWAIPFPFQQGEGPQHYKETWEMKRLMLLLSSLMRNLRNWRRQGGTISVNPLPPERPYRSRSKQPFMQNPGDDSVDSLLNLDLLSPFDLPDPNGIDLSLENLLNIFTSYEMSSESALNVDLGALSNGDPISDILFETSATAQQTVPWDDYTNLLGMALDSQTDSSLLFTPEASQEAQDVDMADAEQLLNGMANSTFDLSLWSDLFDQGAGGEAFMSNSGQNPPMDFMPNVPLEKMSQVDVDVALNALHQGEQTIPDQELQAILDMALSASVNDIPLPSMTASPSISATIHTATPTLNSVQMLDTMSCSAPSHHPISTLSRRGKGRSTQALRRDLNKQLRLNATDASTTHKLPSASSHASSPTEQAVKGKKVRVSEVTLRERERTLEQAKEWREIMAKELEMTRVTRWEATIEGLVLQEVGVLLRNGPNE
jgi:hypothetical protein